MTIQERSPESDVIWTNPAQQKILESGLLTTGFSCVLQLPTGSGKTWLAEQAIERVLSQGRRAVYLSPLRALAAELYDRWSKKFDDVGVFTGDTMSTRSAPPVPFKRARLLVMTPERLDACTRHWRSHWSWIPEVDLLVVDELHLLGESGRGSRLEGAMLRLRRLNPFARVLGLSATLGNRGELAEWLDGVEFKSDWRTVPLTWRVRRFRKADMKPELMADEVGSCIRQGGKSLIFVQSRRRAETLSSYLRGLGIAAGHHHAGLSKDQRTQTEAEFRGEGLNALFSTGTLEMGLNLPVRQVLLYDLQAFNGTDFSSLSVNTVWQRAGRAGRPGLDSQGEVVLLSPSWTKQAAQYEKGQFEPIRSGLADPSAMAEQVVAEVGSGLCQRPEQLQRAFNSSLAAQQQRMPSIKETLSRMVDSGMLVEIADDDSGKPPRLRATKLGKIAVRQMLPPDTVLYLKKNLSSEQNDNLTFLDLLIISIGAPGFEPLIPCDFEDIAALGAHLARERSYLLQGTPDEITRRLGQQGRRFIAVLNTALIARTWTRLGDRQATVDRCGCYPFEVQRLTESLARTLSAVSAILTQPKAKEAFEQPSPDFPLDDFVPVVERARALLAMVQHGLDEEVATLTYITGIGSTWARRLKSIGLQDIEDLAQAELSSLESLSGLSAARAEKWINEAITLLSTFPPGRLRELGPVVKRAHNAWPAGVDPYRLGRALELRVEHKDQERFLVSGGLEPHWVVCDRSEKADKCDCADYSAGHTCKHILAARIANGDETLGSLIEAMRKTNSSIDLDLHAIWLQRA